jgi:membrane protease YdiL (CAAX protease family)
MGSILTRSETTTARGAWLGGHPLVGAAAVAVLAGAALQLTHVIGFQDRVAAFIGWGVAVLWLDLGFRTLLGAVVVLAVLPWLFGYSRSRPWFGEYRRRLRATAGSSPGHTIGASVASVSIMAALIVGTAFAVGVRLADPAAALASWRWFMVVLALVPGLWEELAFRGLILSNLQDRYRPWVAIAISSLLFGLFHISNLLLRGPDQVIMEMVMAAVVSLAWGYAVVATGSVIPAIASHYFINVFIELLLPAALSESASAAIFGSLTFAYPVLTIIAVWWICRPRHTTGHASPITSPGGG